MPGKGTYHADRVINVGLRNTSITPAATVYAALFTATPNAGGGGTEVSGGSYARAAITFSAPSSGSTSNSADCTFPTATGSWSTVTSFALVDSASGAFNLLYFANLSTSRAVISGDSVKFSSAAIVVTEA